MYTSIDILGSSRMNGARAQYAYTREDGVPIYRIRSATEFRIRVYVLGDGTLWKIRYHNWWVYPWGEAHWTPSDPRYNIYVNPELFTMDEFLDYLDSLDNRN